MSKRWGWVTSEWKAGNYKRCISIFLTSVPNLTFPPGPEEMDNLHAQHGSWNFTGPMAYATWWRELWHGIGGVALTLPVVLFPRICFTLTLLIAIGFAAREFYSEGSFRPDLKSFVDFLCWTLGSALVTVISFVLFGPGQLK